MPKLENLTKAQLIEHLKEEQEKVAALEKEKEIRDKKIDADMSFAQTSEERTEKQKAQDEKDFIKKMTHGRWTSQEKYQKYMESQQKGRRLT